MRIAMIGSRGIPARSGGVESVVEALTDGLCARGHDVLVYARKKYIAGLDSPAHGMVITTAGLSGKHTDALTHTATAMADVIKRDVDIVHVHSPGPAIWSFLPKLAKMKIVFTVHAPDWDRDKWSLPARASLKLGLAMGMKLADAVTSVSQPLAHELEAKFNRPVHFIPNAPPRIPACVSDQPLEKWALTGKNFGLYVGRIVPEKRLDMLITAWRAAPDGVPLVIVGDLGGLGDFGNLEKKTFSRKCRALAEGVNVKFIGPQFGLDLAALYANCSVLIQPSVLEGMSMVLLEAAAWGRCIIAADIPANRDHMGKSILYFIRDDIPSLEAQIGRCLSSEETRSGAGLSALDRSAQLPQWSDVAELTEQVYLHLE